MSRTRLIGVGLVVCHIDKFPVHGKRAVLFVLADPRVVPIAIVGRSLVFLCLHVYGVYCLPNVLSIGGALATEPVNPWFVLGVMARLIWGTKYVLKLTTRFGD